MKKSLLVLMLGISTLVLVGCGKKEIPEPIQEPEVVDETEPTEEATIKSFEECMLAGFPVMESYPRQCNDGNTTFTETIQVTQPTTIETGNTNEGSGIIQVQKPEIKTGSSESGDSSLSQYIEKLRYKKGDQNSSGAGESVPKTNPEAITKEPENPDPTGHLAPSQPSTNEGVTEQDIEKLEKIINDIAK